MSALITTQGLSEKLVQPGLRLLDASWHMPASGRDARAEFAQEHIPGAAFFDIDAVSDRQSPYPHMLPAADEFARTMGALGISNADEVVVYDTDGLFSAARVWWMFRAFGHDKVRVLDGGLPKWKAERKPLASGEPHLPPARFTTHFRPELLRTREQVRTNITAGRETLLDARSPGRFSGSEPEPRPGLRSGHIEGSVNLFFRDCIAPPYNTLKKPEALRTLLAARGIDPMSRLAATCGSGVTACILALALHELGNKDVAVYDGAWAEWGSA